MDHQQHPLDALRTARFVDGVRCPRCSSERTQRWGGFAGRQRYRCRGCRRTFSDLTGTPAAYLKKTDLLPAYAACMARGLSVRGSARAVGVHPATAFRWRHRLCRALAERREPIGGWIEVAVVRLPESRKGDRRLTRPPRRTRWPPSMIPNPLVCVVIALDRRGRLASGVAGTSPLRPDGYERVIGPSLKDRWALVLAHEGPLGAAARFARARRGAFRDVRVRHRRRSLEHVESAREYGRRFLRWLKRFAGVATKYLDHYLAWHRTLDTAARFGLPEASFSGRFPVRDAHSSGEQTQSVREERPVGGHGAPGAPLSPLVSHPDRSDNQVPPSAVGRPSRAVPVRGGPSRRANLKSPPIVMRQHATPSRRAS
jgi:transposase-like protein